LIEKLYETILHVGTGFAFSSNVERRARRLALTQHGSLTEGATTMTQHHDSHNAQDQTPHMERLDDALFEALSSEEMALIVGGVRAVVKTGEEEGPPE
jgi:hypothetical protein